MQDYKSLCTVPSIIQHLSYDDCLEDKRYNYQNCSVLYCVTHLCVMYTDISSSCR